MKYMTFILCLFMVLCSATSVGAASDLDEIEQLNVVVNDDIDLNNSNNSRSLDNDTDLDENATSDDVSSDDDIRGEIDRYRDIYENNNGNALTDNVTGPHYSYLELLLEIYKDHTCDDTAVILNQVLGSIVEHYYDEYGNEIGMSCFFTSESFCRQLIDSMHDGTIFDLVSDNDHFDADFYMELINQIDVDKGSF